MNPRAERGKLMCFESLEAAPEAQAPLLVLGFGESAKWLGEAFRKHQLCSRLCVWPRGNRVGCDAGWSPQPVEEEMQNKSDPLNVHSGPGRTLTCRVLTQFLLPARLEKRCCHYQHFHVIDHVI